MIARLKELRKQKGTSQQQLAEFLGISQQSVNKYENHGIEPDIWTLITLADYFETSVDYLVGHTDVNCVLESESLSQEENALLNDWRRLTKQQQESILLVVRNYLEK